MFYFGLADTPFKESTEIIQVTLNIENMRIGQLKRSNINFFTNYLIASKVSGSVSLIFCQLCLMEKLWIIKLVNNKNLLNKKSELINKCRHLNKFLLANVKNG